MKPHIAFLLCSTLLGLSACQKNAPPAPTGNGQYSAQTWVLPAEQGSLAPDLARAPDGRVLLSWVKRTEGRRNVLQFASYTEQDGWQSQPRTIAVGNSLLANAADTPHIMATPDGALWVQWLQTLPESPSGYDVVLARSKDGGMRWEQITRVNSDGTAAEHGFASLWPVGEDALGVAWLDGRAKKPAEMPMEHAQMAHMHMQGDMQLRANVIDLNLSRGEDAVVDARTCDCCQSVAVLTSKGPLLAWRDRSEEEERDIAVARLQGTVWSAPTLVHADHWRVESCPVSGPAMAAQGDQVVLGWYSEAGGTPLLQLAHSSNAGDSFGAPVVLEKEAATLGRIAMGLDTQQAWVAWLRETSEGQTLMLARYTPDLSKRLQTLEVAKLGAKGMASGYPKLAVGQDMAWLVWTDVSNGVPHVKGARITR